MTLESEIRANANLCVKCGLCLPHCPTYNKTGNENESPRGRIALIQAWSDGNLPGSIKLINHIDNCLLCRSCEKVCPAKVPYGKLVDSFRGCIHASLKHSMGLLLLKKISHSTKLNEFTRFLLRLYQKSGLQASGMANLVKLRQINRLLSVVSSQQVIKVKQVYSAEKPAKGEVGLFHGCMGKLLDQETVVAAIRVLNQAGYTVYLPDRQTCCGALDLHSGDLSMAEKLAKSNVEAFLGQPLDAIVTIASGCGATLQEYDDRDFSAKVIDISQFLMQPNVIDKLSFSILNSRIVIHSPCSLKNVMQADESVVQLLKRIPGVKITVLSNAIKCCGSAGSYMLEHPKMANSLLNDLLEEVNQETPDYLVTSNIGCALHIAAGLKEMGEDLEVVHPVLMIQRALSNPWL